MTGMSVPSDGTVGRRRRRASTEARIPILLGPLVALFGAAFLILGIATVRDELRLAGEGMTTHAVVDHIERHPGTGDEADTFWVVYHFTTSEGAQIAGRSSVDQARFRSTAPGDVVTVTYLPAQPSTSRLGTSEFRPFPVVAFPLFGLVALVFGVVLLWTAIRQRRAATAARAAGIVGGELPLPAADATGTIRFSRSPARVLVDLVLAPLGAVSFLGVATWMVAQVGRDPLMAIGGLLFGFFGVGMATGAAVTVRRGARSALLEIRRDGIWMPELGRQPWSAIREIRIEDPTVGESGRRTQGYRRIAAYPRDPELAAHAPGGTARWLDRAYFGFVRLTRPSSQARSLADRSPFGVAQYELDVPLEAIVPLLTPYIRVVDDDGSVLGEPSGSERAPAPDQVAAATTTPAVDAPAAPRAVGATPFVAGAPGGEPASRTGVFLRRGNVTVGAGADVLRALGYVVMPSTFAVVFLAIGVGSGSLGGLFAGAFVLLVALIFVLTGVPALLEAVGRFQVGSTESVALAVDDEGISMTEMGRLRWDEIAEVRVGQVDIVEAREGAAPDRPRLEIVPRDPRRLDARGRAARARDRFIAWQRRIQPWGERTPRPGTFSLDLDLLEADPDEVIDVIATHRLVEEE